MKYIVKFLLAIKFFVFLIYYKIAINQKQLLKRCADICEKFSAISLGIGIFQGLIQQNNDLAIGIIISIIALLYSFIFDIFGGNK